MQKEALIQHAVAMHRANHAKSDDDAEDASEGGLDSGDEDIFQDYVLTKLGINLNYWLFPGLIMHEFSHYIMCVLAGSRVHEVVWWSPKGGHVVHTRVRGSASVIISLAPLLLNLLAALLIADALPMLSMRASTSDFAYGLAYLWLGFSLAVFSFPSRHDLKMSRSALQRSFSSKANRGGYTGMLAIIAYPFAYTFHFILTFFIAPFSTNRTLRLAWGLALIWLVATYAPSTL